MNIENSGTRPKYVTWLIILSAIPAYIVILVVLTIITGIVVALVTNTAFSDLGSIGQEYEMFSQFATQINQLIAVIIIVNVYWVKIFKNSFVSIGFRDIGTAGKEILQGFLTGVFLIGSIFLTLYLSRQIEVTGIEFSVWYFIFYLVLFVLVGINEELLFRGYLLGTTIKLANKYLVLAIFALLFSLVHFLSNEFSLFPILNIFLAGIILGLYYIHTQRLWYSISLHFTWNFLLGPVMGSNVSGNETSHSVVQQNMLGKDWVTGGTFGFEGSAVMTVILVLLITGTEIYFRYKNIENQQKEKDPGLEPSVKY